MMPPPLSRARRAGDLLFVSGQLPRGPEGAIINGAIEAQAHCALGNLKGVIEREGAALSDVVKTTVWLTRGEDVGAFNTVYREYFAEPWPARSLVISQLAAADALIEIEAVAHIR